MQCALRECHLSARARFYAKLYFGIAQILEDLASFRGLSCDRQCPVSIDAPAVVRVFFRIVRAKLVSRLWRVE